MNSAECDGPQTTPGVNPNFAGDEERLLNCRYEDVSKEQDATFELLPEQAPWQVLQSHRYCLPRSIPHIGIASLLNLTVLVVIMVFSIACYSSIQNSLTMILKKATHASTHRLKLMNSTWNIENFKTLVVFGDSYSAENELWLFMDHFDNHDHEEWKNHVVSLLRFHRDVTVQTVTDDLTFRQNPNTAVGGYVWPRWTAWYTGARVYNYAVGGAVCSSRVTPNVNVLGVQEHQLVSFQTDVVMTNDHTSRIVDVESESTVYAIFLGANDFGASGFMTQHQLEGKTLDDWLECVFRALDRIYQVGGRNFVIMNVVPLERSPTFNSIERGGAVKSGYWPDKPENSKIVSQQMEQIVRSVNYGLRYQAAYEMRISGRFPGAKLAYFNTYNLFSDIIANPERYLNGTAKANIADSCKIQGSFQMCTSRDSYLWFDGLHPSEQASRLLAREMAETVHGGSKYAEYWDSSI